MDTIQWKEVYLQLFAYADGLLKAYKWFRGKDADTFLKGKQAHDYVNEAIEMYLTEPNKFNPERNESLVKFLKYNIIRSLIGNDARSAENRLSTDLFKASSNDSDDGDESYIDSLMPFVSATFDQELDYDRVLKEIKNQLSQDSIASAVFDYVRDRGYTRRAAMKEIGISEAEFDNAMRRVNTILKKTAKNYRIKETL